METTILSIIPIAARVLIGFFFLFFGGWNIVHWQPTLVAMQQKKIPFAACLLAFGIAFQCIAGLMIIFGIEVKLFALLLIPFTLFSIFMFHAFWRFEGAMRQLNTLIFVTHLTMTFGGLLLLMNMILPLHNWMDLIK